MAIETRDLMEFSAKKRKIVVVAVCSMAIATWMFTLCFAVAIPEIMSFYGLMKYQAFLMTCKSVIVTVFSLIGGKLGDRIGRKKLIVFVGSLRIVLCLLGLNPPNGTVYIVIYLLMAVCCGLLNPIAYAVVNDISTAEQKPKLVGLLGTMNGLSLVVGIFLGGVVIEIWGKFSIFLLMLPFNFISVLLFLYGFVNKSSQSSARSISFALLKNRGLALSAILAALVPAFVFLTSTGLTQYGQLSLGLSPAITGTLALPKNILFVILPPFIGMLLAKNSRNYRIISLLCGVSMAVGSILTLFYRVSMNIVFIYCVMLVFGLASSCQVTFIHAYYPFFIPGTKIGEAAALISFMQSISTALMSAIYSFIYDHNYDSFMDPAGSGMGQLVQHSYKSVAWISVVFGSLIIISTVVLYRDPAEGRS